jgi:hypothetical protein
MNTLKRHHIIPRLHLQHFVDAGGRVWSYEKQSGKIWASLPEDTAVESHFYSGERPDGTMDTRIEEHLAKIESAAAPTYSALLRGEIPGETQERADFAHVLGLMYSRTRAMRRVSAETYARFIQIQLYAQARQPPAFAAAIERYEAEIGRKLTAEEREAARRASLDPSQFEIEVPKDRTFPILAAADQLAPLLFRMNWWLMTAAEGVLITSDNPLVRTVRRGTVHPIYGDGGFLNPTAEITFPLSPTKLLLMAWSSVNRRAILPLDLVRRANIARAAQSELFLYASFNDPHIQQLANQFRDSRPTVKTEGLGPTRFARVKVARRRGD